MGVGEPRIKYKATKKEKKKVEQSDCRRHVLPLKSETLGLDPWIYVSICGTSLHSGNDKIEKKKKQRKISNNEKKNGLIIKTGVLKSIFIRICVIYFVQVFILVFPN